MKIRQHEFGPFVKEGVRHFVQPDEEQTRDEAVAEALADGYVRDGLGAMKLRKKSESASSRYEQEMGGFQLPPEQGGLFVRTDSRTRTLLNAAALRAASDPTYKVENWKTAEGLFITLTNAMILTLNGAVEQFIAGCFAKEAALNGQIDAATTVDEIKAINW